MCSAFTPDCGYQNGTIILIGDVYCPNTKGSGKFYRHKKTFKSLGRSDNHCPQCASVYQVRKIAFENQTNSFFLSLGQWFYIFEETPKSIPDVIGERYSLSWQVLFHQREIRISWRLCNNSEIHSWLWKVWRLVSCSQSSFYVTRTCKNDKKRQKSIFSARKRWTYCPLNNCSFMSHFNQPKIEGSVRVDNTVQETIGDMFCSTCRNEKWLYF